MRKGYDEEGRGEGCNEGNMRRFNWRSRGMAEIEGRSRGLRKAAVEEQEREDLV